MLENVVFYMTKFRVEACGKFNFNRWIRSVVVRIVRFLFYFCKTDLKSFLNGFVFDNLFYFHSAQLVFFSTDDSAISTHVVIWLTSHTIYRVENSSQRTCKTIYRNRERDGKLKFSETRLKLRTEFRRTEFRTKRAFKGRNLILAHFRRR